MLRSIPIDDRYSIVPPDRRQVKWRADEGEA